jgi:hypothetical protein
MGRIFKISAYIEKLCGSCLLERKQEVSESGHKVHIFIEKAKIWRLGVLRNFLIDKRVSDQITFSTFRSVREDAPSFHAIAGTISIG